jgi:hypothetical protein
MLGLGYITIICNTKHTNGHALTQRARKQRVSRHVTLRVKHDNIKMNTGTRHMDRQQINYEVLD